MIDIFIGKKMTKHGKKMKNRKNQKDKGRAITARRWLARET